MKKIFFLILTLCAVKGTQAQITYEGTKTILRLGAGVQRYVATSTSVEQDGMIVGDYILTARYGEPYYDVYNANMELVKTFSISDSWFGVPVAQSYLYGWNFISQGIFTTDGKWACLVTEYEIQTVTDTNGNILKTNYLVKELRVVDEDGNVITTIPYTGKVADTQILLSMIKIGDKYLLLIPTGENTSNLPYSYDIYSLPGKGEPAVLASPSSSKNSSNRKLIRDNQLFVETENNKYNAQGARVE